MTRRNARHRPPRQRTLARPGWLAKYTVGPGGRRWVVIIPSVAAFLGLVAVAAYVISGAGQAAGSNLRQDAALGRPNPDATEPVPQYHVPASARPAALPSTGAIPLPTGEQPLVTSWNAGRGGAALKAVSSHAGDVAQASGQKQYVEMKAACSQLATAVADAQAAPPIPDAGLQTAYLQALSGLGKAASECQAAISEQADGEEYVATTENKATLKAAESALEAGSRELFRATGGIVTLGQRD